MTIKPQQALAFNPPDLLIDRFCSTYNVTRKEALARFQETKKFLVICAADRYNAYSPSRAVDLMWHQFMLHSKDYFTFCEMIGGYIHHQPSETHEPKKYMKTLEALKEMFGEIDRHFWEENSSDCTSCESCYFG